MIKIVSTTLLVLLLFSLNAQTIPADRRVDWRQIAKDYTYKTPEKTISILNFGGMANGETDNSDALKQAIASFHNRAGTIFFPAGTYLFNNTVVLPDSIQLKGDGSDVTVLEFDLNQQPKNCIQITGTAENHFVRLKGNYSFGSEKLLSDSASYFHVGNWVEILEKNGNWNTIPADWAKNSV